MILKATMPDASEGTIKLLWKQHDENEAPAAPASYDVATVEDAEWHRHPIVPRGGYVFVSASINDGAFGTPVIAGVAVDPP